MVLLVQRLECQIVVLETRVRFSHNTLNTQKRVYVVFDILDYKKK